jgi:protein TonB
LALRAHASATVVLDLEIDAQGKVVKATPVGGPVLFHNAAVSAAMKWRYKPASIDGTNVPSQSRVTMNFNLNK